LSSPVNVNRYLKRSKGITFSSVSTLS
jgi:hypothetical protein